MAEPFHRKRLLIECETNKYSAFFDRGSGSQQRPRERRGKTEPRVRLYRELYFLRSQNDRAFFTSNSRLDPLSEFRWASACKGRVTEELHGLLLESNKEVRFSHVDG